jgi:hypothetical protein
MLTPHRSVNVVGRIALTGIAALATMTLAACGSSPSTVWIADDLERAGGRYYVTCEAQHDPDNDNLEIQVWVTDTQARNQRKGGPCPNGTVRHIGSDVTGYTVGKPLRPTQPTTTSNSKPTGPTTARPSTKTTPQSSAPKTAAGKPSATNKPPAQRPQGPARQGPKPAAPRKR